MSHLVYITLFGETEGVTLSRLGCIEEVVRVQTLTVPGATPRPLLYQGVVLG